MADIAQTQDVLIAAFADNTTGNITAQNMRNFVLSIQNLSSQYFYLYAASAGSGQLNYNGSTTITINTTDGNGIDQVVPLTSFFVDGTIIKLLNVSNGAVLYAEITNVSGPTLNVFTLTVIAKISSGTFSDGDFIGVFFENAPVVIAAGNNTNIQFNDTGSLSGSDNLAWHDSAQTLAVTGTGNANAIVASNAMGQIATMADGSQAISATNGVNTVNLCDISNNALYSTDGTREVFLCDTTQAVQCLDGSNTVYLCNVTNAITAWGACSLAAGNFTIDASGNTVFVTIQNTNDSFQVTSTGVCNVSALNYANGGIDASGNISTSALISGGTLNIASSQFVVDGSGAIVSSFAIGCSGNVGAASFSGDGSALTNLTPANIAAGTLPALDGSALTNLTPANIAAGTLPALDGSALTNLTAGNIAGGGTFLGIDGSALTNLTPTNIAAGTANISISGVAANVPATGVQAGTAAIDISGTAAIATNVAATGITAGTAAIDISGTAAMVPPGGIQAGTLPALDGSALTNLTTANLAAGTLPALDGSALTNLTAGNIAGGGTFLGIDGSALTNLTPANIAAGSASIDISNPVLVTVSGTPALGFFGTSPVAHQAANQAMTDSTTGTPSTTLVDVTTTALADPTKCNDNFASLNARLDEIRTLLTTYGLGT